MIIKIVDVKDAAVYADRYNEAVRTGDIGGARIAASVWFIHAQAAYSYIGFAEAALSEAGIEIAALKLKYF